MKREKFAQIGRQAFSLHASNRGLFAQRAKLFLATLQSVAIGRGRQNHVIATTQALHWQP